MRPKFLQTLCLSFGIASFALSAVVYGQLSTTHKDSCLVVGIHQPIGKSKNNVVSVITQLAQEFLTYQNVPIQISYVRVGEQFEVAEGFFGHYAGAPVQSQPSEIEPQQLVPLPQPIEEARPSFEARLQNENPTPIKVASETESINSVSNSEKPVLRDPSL